jgi:hypothetical protein
LVGRFGGYYDVKYFRHCDHLVANTHDLVRAITAAGLAASACASFCPISLRISRAARAADLPHRQQCAAAFGHGAAACQ